MNLKELTIVDKLTIKDAINSYYGLNLITSVESVEENQSTLIIYQDKEKTNAIHIDEAEFRSSINKLILG